MSRLYNIISLFKIVIALIISLFFILIIILFTSHVPRDAIYSLLIRPLTKSSYLWHVVERMIPITFTGLAVCIIFSVNEFNLAIEGSFYVGGFVATLCGIYVNLPPIIHPIFCICMGGIAGILTMAIPSLLNAKFNTSIMVISLMLNYIILQIVLHILTNVIRDQSFSAVATLPISITASISKIKYQTSFGIIIALIMSILCGILIYNTKLGFYIRLVGENRKYAIYSGINITFIVIISQLIGGGIAAIGGGIEILGYYGRFRWSQLPGYGWTGIVVAILAKNNPWKVPVATFFLAYLEVGCEMMQIYADIQPEVLDIIKPVILLLFAAKNLIPEILRNTVIRNASHQ